MRHLFTAVCLALGLLATSASAQLEPGSVAELKSWHEKLHSEDQFVRIVALQEALESGRIELLNLGYNAAFNSGDIDMQSIALRYYLIKGKVIPLEFFPSQSQDSEKLTAILDGSSLLIERFNKKDNLIDAWFRSKRQGSLRGKQSRSSLDLQGSLNDLGACRLFLRIVSRDHLQGELSCTSSPKIIVRANLD